MFLQEGGPLADQHTHSLPALLEQGDKVRAGIIPGGEGIEWVLGWEGDRVWEGCFGVTWMRCTTDGRAWLESDWSGIWDLGMGRNC